jgi:hypothetical protein
MAVKVNIGEKTTRTHPRLMRLRDGENENVIVFATERGIMHLSGPHAGQYLASAGVAWENLDDLDGSVTLHNAD